jgi:1,4-dihydroxy-2-naphthoate octaprenyltransferase
MIRLHIVVGGVLAFSVGALLAFVNGGSLDPLRLMIFYLVVFLGDLSTHFSNDYFDVEQDKRAVKKKRFSGSKKLVEYPDMLPSAYKAAVLLLAASLAVSAAAVIFQVASPVLFLIALAANFLGWFYSAPPLRLVSRGLGEAAIALAVGFAVPAVGYLSVLGELDGYFMLFAVPFVLYGFMLAFSLEAPDVDVDRLGDKKTFGVRFGVKALYSLIALVASAAFLLFLLYAGLVNGGAVCFWVVSVFALAPLASGLAGLIIANRGGDVETGSTVNIAALFLLNLLLVTYLLTVALH